jgi:hypothetical protein
VYNNNNFGLGSNSVLLPPGSTATSSADARSHETPSSGSRGVPRGRADSQTDLTTLIVAFRNFANEMPYTSALCCPRRHGITRAELCQLTGIFRPVVRALWLNDVIYSAEDIK